jgi:hypothetical protein
MDKAALSSMVSWKNGQAAGACSENAECEGPMARVLGY